MLRWVLSPNDFRIDMEIPIFLPHHTLSVNEAYIFCNYQCRSIFIEKLIV